MLVAALAAGVILASDVFHSGASVETLLFGSLLLIDGADLAWAAAATSAVLLATAVLGARVARDAASTRGRPAPSACAPPVPDAVLLALVALVAVAALSATGALLATAMLVVPAATTRLFCDRIGTWQLATVALAAAEGVVGLWLAVELNAPSGAAIAVLTGGVFAVVAAVRALREAR